MSDPFLPARLSPIDVARRAWRTSGHAATVATEAAAACRAAGTSPDGIRATLASLAERGELQVDLAAFDAQFPPSRRSDR